MTPRHLDLNFGNLKWAVISDAVMGGISRCRVSVRGDKAVVFEGEVSLENSGGFASARAEFDSLDLSPYDKLVMRVRGDGNRYRIRLWMEPGVDRIAYQAAFDTTRDIWLNTVVPFASFSPTFRGQTPVGAGPLDRSRICQVGLMIADKQAGPFEIEIEDVKAS